MLLRPVFIVSFWFVSTIEPIGIKVDHKRTTISMIDFTTLSGRTLRNSKLPVSEITVSTVFLSTPFLVLYLTTIIIPILTINLKRKSKQEKLIKLRHWGLSKL